MAQRGGGLALQPWSPGPRSAALAALVATQPSASGLGPRCPLCWSSFCAAPSLPLSLHPCPRQMAHCQRGLPQPETKGAVLCHHTSSFCAVINLFNCQSQGHSVRSLFAQGASNTYQVLSMCRTSESVLRCGLIGGFIWVIIGLGGSQEPGSEASGACYLLKSAQMVSVFWPFKYKVAWQPPNAAKKVSGKNRESWTRALRNQ